MIKEKKSTLPVSETPNSQETLSFKPTLSLQRNWNILVHGTFKGDNHQLEMMKVLFSLKAEASTSWLSRDPPVSIYTNKSFLFTFCDPSLEYLLLLAVKRTQTVFQISILMNCLAHLIILMLMILVDNHSGVIV